MLQMAGMEEPSKRCGEILLETERFHGKAEEENQEALALVLDLAKAFERVSLPVPRKILRVLCGDFELQKASAVRRMCG